jgi:hypothetical protein
LTIDPDALADDLAREAGLVDPDTTASSDGPALALTGLAVRVVGVGWATVDLDRARAGLGAPVDAGTGQGPTIRDELLGARGVVLESSPGGVSAVLLEPYTEGWLASALARRGEGPAVLYLAPTAGDLAAALDQVSREGSRVRFGRCALGPGAIVLGRSPAGPHLLLVAVPSGP